MNHRFVSHSGNRRLILLAAGWAMDANPFAGLRRHGYDIAVVWDCAAAPNDWEFAAPYDEVCLIAWSLAVAAINLPQSVSAKTTARIAVGGTPVAIDDDRGIPRALFGATRANLSSQSLSKFYRRVCGSAGAFARFLQNQPQREIDDLAEELDRYLGESPPSTSPSAWDLAIITGSDLIVPPQNQRRAWEGVPTVAIDSPHLPDFQKIISTYIVDKDTVRRNFARHSGTYLSAAGVQTRMASRLWNKILEHTDGPINHALEVGSGAGTLTALMERECHTLEAWDFAHAPASLGPATTFRQCDAETAVASLAAARLDLIASGSAVQWFNSPAEFFRHCRRALRPGGLLAVATFIKGNLEQVARATGAGLPVPSADEWKQLLPPDMEIVWEESGVETLLFDTPAEVFRHLRDSGVNSLGGDDPAAVLRKALANYPPENGHYPLTYRTYMFIARK